MAWHGKQIRSVFPCMNCSERTFDCHCICEKYTAATQLNKKIKDSAKSEYEAYCYLAEKAKKIKGVKR